MTLKQFPAAERPRERLLTHGPLPLTDAELLAIFLRTGTAGVTRSLWRASCWPAPEDCGN